jgi:hypothetical protein
MKVMRIRNTAYEGYGTVPVPYLPKYLPWEKKLLSLLCRRTVSHSCSTPSTIPDVWKVSIFFLLKLSNYSEYFWLQLAGNDYALFAERKKLGIGNSQEMNTLFRWASDYQASYDLLPKVRTVLHNMRMVSPSVVDPWHFGTDLDLYHWSCIFRQRVTRCLLPALCEGTFAISFHRWNLIVEKKSQNSRNQGFSFLSSVDERIHIRAV